MSVFFPAPLTIVVSSFSTVTFLARPSILIVTFSSLIPRSAETMVPPVRIAISSSIALRRCLAFDHLQFGLERLCLFDCNYPLVANSLHGVGNKAANLGIAVGGDRADLGDLLVRRHLFGVFLEIGDNCRNG